MLTSMTSTDSEFFSLKNVLLSKSCKHSLLLPFIYLDTNIRPYQHLPGSSL